jgi:hypothetical protein
VSVSTVSILPSSPPAVAPLPWSDQLSDAFEEAENQRRVLILLIRHGDNGLGRRLQLETAEKRVRALGAQLAEVGR